jgi:thioredoxin 1
MDCQGYDTLACQNILKTLYYNRYRRNDMSEHLTKESFKSKVFDWEKNKEWKYSGDVPAIVDFYADWCGPCKMLSPVLEELAVKYDGKLHIYKVDTEKEPELAGLFEVQSIPTILFVPMEGAPAVAMGALPKKDLERAISEVLKVV